jgi:hypothetical protein
VGTILGGGDYLPKYEGGPVEGEKRPIVRPKYKDGETPGQEWNSREVWAIRALANPAFPSDKAAARAARVTMARLKRWKRNPYFMNSVHDLASYNLKKYRSKVFQAVIKNALGKSFSDRQLYFRLIGELKDERKITTVGSKHVHLTESGEPEPFLDDVIQRDVASFSDAAVKKLMKLSKDDDVEGSSA